MRLDLTDQPTQVSKDDVYGNRNISKKKNSTLKISSTNNDEIESASFSRKPSVPKLSIIK